MGVTSLGQYASPYDRETLEKIVKDGGFSGLKSIDDMHPDYAPTEDDLEYERITTRALTPSDQGSSAVGSAEMYMAMLVQKKQHIDNSMSNLMAEHNITAAEAKNISISVDNNGQAKVSGIKDAAKAKKFEEALNKEKTDSGYTLAAEIKSFQDAEKMGDSKLKDAFGKGYSQLEEMSEFEAAFKDMANYLSDWKSINVSSFFKAKDNPKVEKTDGSDSKSSSLSFEDIKKKFTPSRISIEA